MVTQKQLEAIVTRLNLQTKRKYSLDYAYGGVKLVYINEDTSEHDISARMTKSDLYWTIHAMAELLYMENK